MPIPIIRTKLHRPVVSSNIICRKSLHDKLDAGHHRPLTLVSAPAGYGKTTLISHWLGTSDTSNAWLSLDENDSDLWMFLAYLTAAVQTIDPQACKETIGLLKSGELPTTAVLAGILNNELDSLTESFFLVLDDYHTIRETAVHDLLNHLLTHPPRTLSLVIVTRRNPPLSIPAFRARKVMTEIRTRDLQFTASETSIFIDQQTGNPLSMAALTRLQEITEGWAVGLHLVALAIEHHRDADRFVLEFDGNSRQIQEYLVSEILSHQPPVVRHWLKKTSILNRFCAPLCEAVCGKGPTPSDGNLSGDEFIETLRGKGLLCIALDERQQWYRYHHLFQDLLKLQLKVEFHSDEIFELHHRASIWFENHGFLEEALQHAIHKGFDTQAGRMIVRHRQEITQKEQWSRLDRWLRLLGPSAIDGSPELLMLKAWAMDNRGRVAETSPTLDLIESLLTDATGDTGTHKRLQGEVDALRSSHHYYAANGRQAVLFAMRALESLPNDYISERAFATIILAVAHQMNGEARKAYNIAHEALRAKVQLGSTYHGRMLIALALIQWLEGDLTELLKTSSAMMSLGEEHGLKETSAWGRYLKGIAMYHHDRLEDTKTVIEPVILNSSIANINNYLRCTSVLAFTLQAQGASEKARKLVENNCQELLKTGNTGWLRALHVVEAELALRQGRLAEAIKWSESLEYGNPQAAYGFFLPEVTLGKVLILQGTEASLEKAADLLGNLSQFFKANHNKRFYMEVLALRAMLFDKHNDGEKSMKYLHKALTLAQPGGFIRLFVDLGPDIARLIHRLNLDEEALRYAGRILAAFRKKEHYGKVESDDSNTQPHASPTSEPLLEPLSKREREVLTLLARNMTNKEIADTLYISPHTVKVHASNIYGKLRTRNRRETVAKVQGLGILKLR